MRKYKFYLIHGKVIKKIKTKNFDAEKNRKKLPKQQIKLKQISFAILMLKEQKKIKI